MTKITKRGLILGALSGVGLTACGNGLGGNGPARIDGRVDATLNHMRQQYPAARTLENSSKGMLVMPVVTEIGLGFGAGYGRGALRINGATVDYYSAASASAGIQIGAQQHAHVLFFMTDSALSEFRSSRGWVAGANLEYTLADTGQTLKADTTSILSPVVAIVFAQAGLQVGATVEGTKYSRIIP